MCAWPPQHELGRHLSAEVVSFAAGADRAGGAREQKGADKLGYEAEAFAIYDTMKYIKPPVHTLCVGTAFGRVCHAAGVWHPGVRPG